MNQLNQIPQKQPSGVSESQTTHTILMIEPVAFGYNEQTAVNNYFQQKSIDPDTDIQSQALEEFREMVGLLQSKGVKVLVVKDTAEPLTPDSIFPNNWVSFHEGGQVVLYPMFAENRRAERRNDIFQSLSEQGVVINNIDDFASWEDQCLFLEGTGSMILDRPNKIAYAALSERTSRTLFLQFCTVFGYKPVYFYANQSVNGKRLPVYHTNVMLTIADEYAIICLDAIDNQTERNHVVNSLEDTGKDIISITEHQMNCFAGNMLQVENADGKQYLVLSQTAFDSLDQKQINLLSSYNELIVVSIPTIERVGGGSVRCMMAEIF
ncbi:MAG: arginine deiminase-related protein [Paludibacter sp.]|nr:arginine deiminase-related protein [Paludibacter sp.]